MSKNQTEIEFKDIANRAIYKYLNIYSSANDMPRFIKSTNDTGENTAYATPNGIIEVSYEDLNRMNIALLRINPETSKNALNLLKQRHEEDPSNEIIKRKLEAVQDIFNQYGKYIEDPQLLHSTEKEQQYFIEAIVAHEMGHIFFKNKKNPHIYNKEINALNLWSNDPFGRTPTVGRMNDELRADALAIKAMQQHYGKNNPNFNSFLEKFTAFRIISSIPAIYGGSSEYNMYHLYKNNRKEINKLPEFNKENLAEIESKIESITLKNLQEFGITTKRNKGGFNGLLSLYQDKDEWLEESIEENHKLAQKNCEKQLSENPAEVMSLFGGKNIKETKSICVSTASYQYETDFNTKKMAEAIQNSEVFPKISVLTEDNKVIQNGMNVKNLDFNDVIGRVSNENKKFEKEDNLQNISNQFKYK